MEPERKLTFLGKLIIAIFILGCFAGAYQFYRGKGGTLNIPFLAGRRATPPPAATGAPGTSVSTAVPAGPRDVLGKIRQKGELVVGHEGFDAPPMYFKLADGRQGGFENDLAIDLAGRLGVPRVRFVKADYGQLPDLLLQGAIDVIMAGYVPDPSIRGIEWSESYLDFGLCLVVLKSSAIAEPAHLAGRTVAVYDDPAAVTWVRQNIPGATVKTYSGDNGWFEAVERREADALIYDYPFAAEEIKQHPRTKIARFNLNSSRYAIGVAAGNDPLLDALNGFLETVKKSPRYRELLTAYIDYRSDDVLKPVSGGRRSYTVTAGDTLSLIAAARLKSADRWEEIWRLNRERIPNPHLIHPGYILYMP